MSDNDALRVSSTPLPAGLVSDVDYHVVPGSEGTVRLPPRRAASQQTAITAAFGSPSTPRKRRDRCVGYRRLRRRVLRDHWWLERFADLVDSRRGGAPDARA